MADDPATFEERFTGLEQPFKPGPGNEEFALASSKALKGLESYPAHFAQGLLDFFKTPGEATQRGLTPDQEVEFGVNGALATIGSASKFAMPKGTAAAFNAFHDQVTTPAAQRITVPLDARNVAPVQGSDIPQTAARSNLALTGEPHVDAVLTSATTKSTVDNPIVDRTHDVPYTAGGSVPLQDPRMFIDKNFPRAFNIDGVVFDPADPFSIHENVEQHTMDILTKGGMADEEAYRVAHFEFAEKAEGAWYRTHGIDQEKAEAAYAPYMAAIQHDAGTDFPADLYKRPYPHDTPSAAKGEAIAEPRPTPEEIDHAKQIIADWQAKGAETPTPEPEIAQPKPNPLVEARDLGVIGPDKSVPPPQESPARAAQRAIPAARTGDDKITMTPAGEPIDAWDARFAEKVARMKAPEDFKPFWLESAKENNSFIEARRGAVDPAHIEALAESAGIDPTLVDRNYIKKTFNGPDIVRMADQTLKQLSQNHLDAAKKVELDPTPQNIADMLQAEIQRDYALEQAVGLAAEWGRTGHALQSLLQAKKTAVSTGLVEGLKAPKPVKDLTDAIDKFKENTVKAVTSKEDKPLGLDDLIKAASDLVDEATKPKKAGEKPSLPSSPEVNELVKTAQAVVNLMDIERPKGPGVATVRPLRQILNEDSAQGRSILAKFNSIVTEGEKTVTAGIKEGKTPRAAMPPELADMIQRAENVTNFFGGAGLEKAVTDLLADKGRTMEDMQNIARAVSRTDLKGAAKLMSSMRGQNPGLLYWLWVQGLISGPFTHAKYAIANATFALTERGVTTPLAAVIGKLRGNPDRVLGGEASAGLWGLISGVPDALKAAGESMKLGTRFQLDSEKLLIDRLASTGEEIPKDLLRTTNQVTGLNRPIAGVAGRILGFPGDMASGIHTFFKRLGEEAGKNAAAYRQAAQEGKTISDPDFWDRLQFHKANLSTENLQDIIHDAYKGTFMQKLPASMERLQSAVKNGKYLKWIFPFMHIPLNLMRATVEHSPLAFLDPEFRADLLGRNGGRTQDLATSRLLAGSAIMGYFANKYMSGQATGGFPHDPKERAEWQLTGKIPNAIQVGDRWHSFERFGPAGALAGLGADVGHIIASSNAEDPENWTKMVWYAAAAAGDAMADFPGFQSVQNFIRGIEDPQQGMRFAAWEAGSALVPFSSAVTQTASFLDPSMRKARTFIDGLLYRLPGIRENLAPKRDPLYGEPVENPGYQSVIRNAPVNRDPVKSELDRIGYFPRPPQQQISGVKLTPEQYDKFQATAGPLVKQALSNLVSSPQWRMNNSAWQTQVAKEIISAARRRAATAMQLDDPSLILAGRERRLKQIGAAQ